jgi:hypothetical protein
MNSIEHHKKKFPFFAELELSNLGSYFSITSRQSEGEDAAMKAGPCATIWKLRIKIGFYELKLQIVGVHCWANAVHCWANAVHYWANAVHCWANAVIE